MNDPHSYSNSERVQVKHLHLRLEVDFKEKMLKGKASFDIQAEAGTKNLILDSRDLVIEKVELNDKKSGTFTLSSSDPILGQALSIPIDNTCKKVIVWYHTRPEAAALQWLEPSQTAGKKYPFLFTQGQAILSRTWFPCPDGPGIRFSYSADIKPPEDLVAVMSAENNQSARQANGWFHFEMKRQIPAYLVALGIGKLQFQAVDKRTGVFAEPEMLQKTAKEFEDMGAMVTAAEKLYGDYRWGRYDILMLPPSFPFGGMENPCLTFATPTVLAGDKSLTSLVAHELAHSWSGNLVTNATWDDFWLNEGFTVYFERRIMEALEGASYADMVSVLGYTELNHTIADLGEKSPSTHLKLNLKGADPDDGVTDIAYEKGYFFLKMLEQAYGRPAFDAFVKSYFNTFAFSSISTETFLDYLKKNLLQNDNQKYKELQIDSWVYGPGLPSNVSKPVSERFLKVEELAQGFQQSGNVDKARTEKWSSHEWLHFLRNIQPLQDAKQMEYLDGVFHFTSSGNSEIVFEWLRLAIKHQYTPANARLELFLMETGRRKFIAPLYQELVKTEAGKQKARQIFALAKPNYHSVAYKTIEDILAKAK